MHTFKSRYTRFEEGSIRLYIDQSERPDMDTEIYMDASLTHYPLRDYKGLWAEMNNIVKEYQYLGKRNRKKDDNHLNKHAMHLLRLFMMALDILEKEEINTMLPDEPDYRAVEEFVMEVNEKVVRDEI